MEQLKSDIKAIKDELKAYDGKEGKTQADAIEYEATQLAQAMDDYIERKLSAKQVTLTATDVAGTVLVAGTYPVAPGPAPTPVPLDIVDKPTV